MTRCPTRRASGSAIAARKRLLRGYFASNPSAKCPIPDWSGPLEMNVNETDPLPEGYVFIPLGEAEVTRACRKETKQEGEVVYVTYNMLCSRILGIRVPKRIYRHVMARPIDPIPPRPRWTEQDTLWARGKALLLFHFPAIPTDAIDQILETSFTLESRKVGVSEDCVDDYKAHYAVEAHIRHTMTDYDYYLETGWEHDEARSYIRPIIDHFKRSWMRPPLPMLAHLFRYRWKMMTRYPSTP